MPNWCNNYAILTGPKEKIDALIVELRKSDERDEHYEILNTLRPNPSGEWEYDWCVNNWGTKWDVSIGSYEVIDETTVSISFDSAWSPPTTLYEFLTEEGWTVEAYYDEPGMGYCGRFTDGEDEYYEYAGMTADEIAEAIPNEIDDMFCISEYRRDYEKENEDDGETEVG